MAAASSAAPKTIMTKLSASLENMRERQRLSKRTAPEQKPLMDMIYNEFELEQSTSIDTTDHSFDQDAPSSKQGVRKLFLRTYRAETVAALICFMCGFGFVLMVMTVVDAVGRARLHRTIDEKNRLNVQRVQHRHTKLGLNFLMCPGLSLSESENLADSQVSDHRILFPSHSTQQAPEHRCSFLLSGSFISLPERCSRTFCQVQSQPIHDGLHSDLANWAPRLKQSTCAYLAPVSARVRPKESDSCVGVEQCSQHGLSTPSCHMNLMQYHQCYYKHIKEQLLSIECKAKAPCDVHPQTSCTAKCLKPNFDFNQKIHLAPCGLEANTSETDAFKHEQVLHVIPVTANTSLTHNTLCKYLQDECNTN